MTSAPIAACPNPECRAPNAPQLAYAQSKVTFCIVCGCGYQSPWVTTPERSKSEAEAIRLHNLIATRAASGGEGKPVAWALTVQGKMLGDAILHGGLFRHEHHAGTQGRKYYPGKFEVVPLYFSAHQGIPVAEVEALADEASAAGERLGESALSQFSDDLRALVEKHTTRR